MRKLQLNLLCLCFCFIAALSLNGQTHIDWTTLADVIFKKAYDSALGMTYDVAKFGDYVKDLEGKEVIITGYMIPLDAFGVSYALSQNPNKICFFCGGSGPETVIDLQMKPKFIKRYQMDARLTMKGTLQLNENNLDGFNYVLVNAQPL